MIHMQNKRLVVIAVVFIISQLSCQGGDNRDKRPEVTYYASSSGQGVKLNLIFDLDNKGRLCDKAVKTVVLKTYSKSDNPWTYFFSGSFYIALGDKGMEYGSYSYATIEVDKDRWTKPVFSRVGAGEKALGSATKGKIFSVNEKGESKQIGEEQYVTVATPDGETRTVGARIRILFFDVLGLSAEFSYNVVGTSPDYYSYIVFSVPIMYLGVWGGFKFGHDIYPDWLWISAGMTSSYIDFFDDFKEYIGYSSILPIQGDLGWYVEYGYLDVTGILFLSLSLRLEGINAHFVQSGAPLCSINLKGIFSVGLSL